MPFKHYAKHRHHIPKPRYRVNLSRRARTLPVPLRRRRGTGPLHLLVDSTGVKLGGTGEWLVEKHGTSRRQSWRKLHIGIDADSGEIIAIELTRRDIDDGSQTGALLDQLTDPLASFTGDGAYDQDKVYAAVAVRHRDAAVIVLPRATAVPSAAAKMAPLGSLPATTKDGCGPRGASLVTKFLK